MFDPLKLSIINNIESLRKSIEIALNTRNYALARKLIDVTEDLSQFAPDNELTVEERKCADAGMIIDAIKMYRGRTGASLKESKDKVDAYNARPKVQ